MKARLLLSSLAIALSSCGPTQDSQTRNLPQGPRTEAIVATFSIVARDPATGDLGIAVASKFFGVGSVVPWARAGVGAVATQALPNVAYGVDALELLADGTAPEEALQRLTAADPGRDHRQLAIIDAGGRTAAHTGGECKDWAGHLQDTNISIQGNLLAGETVLPEMKAAFDKSRSIPGSELGDWLLAALHAGEAAGGDKRGRQSAAILVVREGGLFGANDRYIDLRVEDHVDPITELTRLMALHKDFFGRQRPIPPFSRPVISLHAPTSPWHDAPAPIAPNRPHCKNRTMSLETYKIIHLAGVMTLFLGLGGMVALQGHGSPPTKKLVTIFHGVGLLLILFGGFGMLAKLPYGMFPVFAMIKGIVWLALGGMLVLGKRRVFSAGVTWVIAIALGVLATWLGLMKPGAEVKPVPQSAVIETFRNQTS